MAKGLGGEMIAADFMGGFESDRWVMGVFIDRVAWGTYCFVKSFWGTNKSHLYSKRLYQLKLECSWLNMRDLYGTRVVVEGKRRGNSCGMGAIIEGKMHDNSCGVGAVIEDRKVLKMLDL